MWVEASLLAHGNYHYPLNTEKGVDIYILDTRVEISHPEFEGRANGDLTLFLALLTKMNMAMEHTVQVSQEVRTS